MDRIYLKDLVVYGIIGVHDWERQKPREIIINLTLYADLRKPGQSDDIEDTIDYGTVAEKVRALAENTECLTIEALAEDIAQLCLDIPKVMSVRVGVDKPGAIRYSRTVGVEIERSREE
jgi:FolB domain-containing protein